MPFSRTQLTAALRELGLKAEDSVMLHASVRAVGAVIGGPDEIHLAVEEAVNPGGTVVMYVGCQDGFDDVGRGIYSPADEAEILRHQPAFDFQVARANRAFGILAEFFRSFPGTIMSQSVGRMAGRGSLAPWLVADQPWNYSYGRGSPLEKLCQAKGRILLLGSDHDEVTLLHYVEHVADFEGKRIARYRVPVLHGAERIWRECEEFDTSGRGVHESWPADFFRRIVDDFIAKYAGTSSCALGRVGNAWSVLLDANALVAHATPMMAAQAGDHWVRSA